MSDDADEYERIILRRDSDTDLRFRGTLIASVANSADRASGDWSGSTGRSTELNLYRTKAGKYVCESIGYTQWQNEHDRHTAFVCEDEAAVVTFFGHDRLAKRLYRKAHIDAAQDIE